MGKTKAQKDREDAYWRDVERRQAEDRRTIHARNQKAIETSKCFVATAAFGDYDAPEVVILRRFRDESLCKTAMGRTFITVYCTLSPPLAAVISRSEVLRRFVRKALLQPTISLLRLLSRY
jgi:hypothetical protein